MKTTEKARSKGAIKQKAKEQTFKEAQVKSKDKSQNKDPAKEQWQ